MISKEKAAKQVSRLAQMVGYPRNEREALNELVVATQSAPTVEVARQAIDNFLDFAGPETRCPMPADIRRAIQGKKEPEFWENETKLDSWVCPTCSDTGMAGGTSANDLWRWCSCHAGARARTEHPDAIEHQNAILHKIIHLWPAKVSNSSGK